MNISYITCSDPRPDVPIEQLIKLLEISPLVELGIQASPANMSNDMPKYKWMDELIKISENSAKPLNIAIHANYQWCDSFCNGSIPNELLFWFYSQNKITSLPTIKRWQLNIGDNTKFFNANSISQIIKNFPDREFIFPYNNKPSVVGSIKKLNKTGAKFSLLYDASYGRGKNPTNWQAPAFSFLKQGYSGGLSPENITQELDRISAAVPGNQTIWIDAEGQLMKPGTREFDVQRADTYINGALNWMDNQR